MTGTGIRNDHFWLSDRGDNHSFVLYKTPLILLCIMRYSKFARHGQFQETVKKLQLLI